MSIASPTTLLLAAVLAAPAIYGATVDGTVDISDAATRYLIAVPLAAVMLWLLRTVTKSYGRVTPKPPARRANDASDDDEALEGDPPTRPA